MHTTCPNCRGTFGNPNAFPQITCPYCHCNFATGCRAPQYPTPSNQFTPSDQVTPASQQIWPAPPIGYRAHIADTRGKPCQDWNWRFMLQHWFNQILMFASWGITLNAYEKEHGEGAADELGLQVFEVLGPGVAVSFFNQWYLQFSSFADYCSRIWCSCCLCLQGDCGPCLTPTVVHEARQMKSAMIMIIPNSLVIMYDGYELFKSAKAGDWKLWVGILVLILRVAAWTYVTLTKRKSYLVFLHDNKIYDPDPEFCACVSCLEPTPVGDDVEGKSSTLADGLEMVAKAVG